MDKEFVSYEQALALKELGFDEECFGYYVITTLLITTDNVYDSKEIPVIKAPLKQQVFRWFREKYEAYATITTETGEGLYHHFIIQGNDAFPTFSKIYYTYEEAETACIDKLIELVKYQDNEK
jgi:hypothetical protein